MDRIEKIMDGNQAAAYVSYAYSEVAAIYPITPSTAMAEITDEWSKKGRKNIFGQEVKVIEMQSEAGAAGTIHGALAAGALATTYTASQGLLLMIPNLYKIAGELLPGVFNVAARTIATHALSIFGDHSDIYACRQTGVAMLAHSNVQEIMDLTVVAHLAAMEGKIPFINFFDGFRTSHEMQKISVWDYETLKQMTDKNIIQKIRNHSLNPNHSKMMGSSQNPDIFFQNREASNIYYDALPEIVEQKMNRINSLLGTDYGLFQYYGSKDAEHIVVAMGSVCETISETLDEMRKNGEKAGLVKVRLYRPFSRKHFLKVLPIGTKKITVLDRTKEPGALGEPLYLDILAAIKGTSFENVDVFSGRYGLGSKDVNPSQIYAIFHNQEKKHFTVGIHDDVTKLSLNVKKKVNLMFPDRSECQFWGLGGDGTVGAAKNTVKIIGNHTDFKVQAYFHYDSKKSRGLTIADLRFGKQSIRSAYPVEQADFVACHNPVYIYKYDMVQNVKDGGIFLLNCSWKEEELEKYLPNRVKRYLAVHDISFYMIDAMRIGKEIGLNNKINTILQATFFHLTNILEDEKAEKYMKQAAEDTYRRKGKKIVKMNFEAIERGMKDVVKVMVKEEWKDILEKEDIKKKKILPDRKEIMEYVKKIQIPAHERKGDKLPVSAFLEYADGSAPSGTTAHERRNVALEVPEWIPKNCIQCNRCSYVCPHAVIRPFAFSKEEQQKAPDGMKIITMMGMPDYGFGIGISDVDCTGCGSCVGVCPGKRGEKALVMKPVKEHRENQKYFDYAKRLPVKPEIFEKFAVSTVKGSQFKRPLLEFSGACAGCGETPYAKLVTQLFGERMYIANATGCTSIWGNSAPSTAYAVNEKGQGPAWSNSLFEDAAEFGLGMYLAQSTMREQLKEKVRILKEEYDIEEAAYWLETQDKGFENQQASEDLIRVLNKYCQMDAENDTKHKKMKKIAEEILEGKDFLSKKSQWIFGGDGWAYDIGYGGLDHVLASGCNVNVLVFDTELYSNTGGQASKATACAASAKFALDGKSAKKKDLAGMAMTYGYVYVAQIAMGADFNQTVKAMLEAESYPGPSLIIAYATCISHGIRAGMGSSMHEEAKAVQSGYWHLFRYNPMRKKEGKNPFQLDSKMPTLDYDEFLKGEIRYDSLSQVNPKRAEKLYKKAKGEARIRYENLKKMEQSD